MEAGRPSPASSAPATWWRAIGWTALAAGIALRAYPLHVPYPQPEVDVPTGTAILEIVRQDWRPLSLFHGTGLVYTLRCAYTALYAIGHATGRYQDRLDLLASFVRDPFPFVLIGRGIMLVLATLALVVAGRTGGLVGGPVVAAGATALLAVSFIHVRESHYVWYDLPAGTAALVTTWLALRAVQRPTPGPLLAAAAAGGLSLAMKHSVFPVAVPVFLAAALGGAASPGRRAARIAAAGATALVAYGIACPYSFLEPQAFLDAAWFTAAATKGYAGSFALSLPRLWMTVIGPAATVLAVVGVVAIVARTWREGLVVGAFPASYVAVLASQGRLHARYLAPCAPLVAVLGAIGADAIGQRVAPRRSGVVTALLLAVAVAGPATQSIQYDMLLARADTRQFAAEWLYAHVPPGTRLTFPSANGHPNPLVPIDETLLRVFFRPWADTLVARGAVDRRHEYPRRFLGGVFGDYSPDWQPGDRYVVVADHPVVVSAAQAPPFYLDRLRAA
ncbi:MAG: hypothetical protein ACREQL_06195, partial [Candidatus Binatia bacterium]